MAIDDLLDEHEQSERVLEWLRRNGAALVGGIVLGLGAIGGWKWWQHHQQQQLMQAADRYHAAIQAIESGEARASEQVEQLGDGLFGILASLELAQSQVAAGDSAAAIMTLRGIDAGDPALAAIVDQRLARLLIDADQAADALELVASGSTAAALEVRGDAAYALGQTERAREAYRQALGKIDVASPQRRILELKLIEVGGTPASTEAQS
ncbi:MAG: tetratricopeptide repeat protein [Proteobacteria bacterium]|nr:tetratricopeptide repeat protein [Pseudomonadota bacterium]